MLVSFTVTAATSALVGWNNLGMHCMDSDYSVFSVLPPYNTIECQLIVGGRLVTNGSGYTVSYEAVSDPSGSFNSTAMGKGNFYQYAGSLYGATGLGAEQGLAGWAMPGPLNVPQSMLFEPTNRPAPGVATLVNWFRAEGIPLSPYDDAHVKNPYPMMRLIARDASNLALATNDIVLPVSDEMDCRVCHASGTQASARPAAGWVWDGLPERDYRLNILRRHDEREFSLNAALYAAALADRKFNPSGLYRSVTADAKPVLCAACHASEALGAPSFGTIPPLTASVHSFHAGVMDPVLKTTLENSANRAACYRCHPGSTTKCLRGAMGAAVAPDGSMEMQCQSCHGSMSQVGSSSRVGWFMEPACQSCHSGTAAHNNGQIRYTSVFDTNGAPRVAVDGTFATQPNTPAAGLSLYRFSAGHGGLQCEACHGSTHAEFPSTHLNDNVRNVAMQGHSGVSVECTACHTAMPNTGNRGPHGMHAVGQGWVTGSGGVTKHADVLSSLGGPAACQPCHGVDYLGTVLSRAKATRTLTASFDQGSITVPLFPGAGIGCYNCHQGPFSESLNTAAAPTVANTSTNTSNDKPVAIPLTATGAGINLRVVTQPAHGAAGITGLTATYFPEPGFVGADSFTFAAYDGHKNSNVGTVSVVVTQGAFSFAVLPTAPPAYPAAWPVPFGAYATITNHPGPVSFTWTFGDGSAPSTEAFPSHTFAAAGTYTWQLVSALDGASVTNTGTITIDAPITLAAQAGSGTTTLTWPLSLADSLLEMTPELGPAAQWQWVTNAVNVTPSGFSVSVPAQGNQFFRLRRAW